jgi:hypothetical protein
VPRLFLIQDGTIELVLNGHYPQNEELLQEELDRVLYGSDEYGSDEYPGE